MEATGSVDVINAYSPVKITNRSHIEYLIRSDSVNACLTLKSDKQLTSLADFTMI